MGLGAYVSGRAGDRAADRSGRGLIAAELPDDVGAILGEHERYRILDGDGSRADPDR